MKRTGYSGASLVVTSPKNSLPGWDGLSHDRWLAHAAGGIGFFHAEGCSSGKVVLAAVFFLNDGNEWIYPFLLSDSVTVSDFLNVPPNAPWTGENWNYLWRGMVFDKVSVADFGAWTIAH